METVVDILRTALDNEIKAQVFYAKALAPLGYKLISQYEGGFGIGAESGSAVWVAAGPAQTPIAHLAFRARDR